MLKLDAGSFDKFADLFDKYGTEAEKAIDEILHTTGEKEIERHITNILPVSHKEKGSHAKFSQPFTHVDSMLSVEVTSRGKWHYLYFPDDGSNTVNHRGNQQFMRRGAEAAADKIIELCTAKIINNLEVN